jgi:hypothetical protein
MFKVRILCVAILAAACLSASSAYATPPGAGAIILGFQPSARAAGMGGAGVATHWGGDVPVWSNPGLLGYRTGVRYSNLDTKIAPGLADDMSFTDESLTIGLGGVTVLLCRKPVAGSYLDMGTQDAVDEDGNVVGEFSSWESAERIGVGLRVVYLVETILGRREHDLSRWGDVGIGYVATDFEDLLAPDSVLQDETGGGASASAHSYGGHLRVTPVNSIGRSGLLSPFGGMRLDLAYGWALLDDSDEMIVHVDPEQGDPFPRRYVSGWSTRVAVDGGLKGLARIFAPLISVGYAHESMEPGSVWRDDHYVYEHDTSGRYDEESWGVEVSFANVVHWRRGHFKAEGRDADGDTRGWGVGLEAPRLGGFRYDEATIPVGSGLPDMDSSSWSVWADLGGLLRID